MCSAVFITGLDPDFAAESAYYMAGVGGQYTLIIPSHELVVVRMGHYKGQAAGLESLKNAVALLLRAVPRGH